MLGSARKHQECVQNDRALNIKNALVKIASESLEYRGCFLLSTMLVPFIECSAMYDKLPLRGSLGKCSRDPQRQVQQLDMLIRAAIESFVGLEKLHGNSVLLR